MKYPTLGDRIRSARAQRGMSQTKFAIRAGLQRPNVASYENNSRTPSLPSFIAMAKALNCSLDWLAGLED